jgi:RNA-binding protein YhbY
MGDDARANQPRPAHAYPPPSVSVSGEFEAAAVTEARVEFETTTPPPIVVDDVGRPVTRSRSDSPAPPIQGKRERLTIQEICEELWPARKALQLTLDQLQRIVKLETRLEEISSHGPAAVAESQIAALRAELVGAEGDAGVVGSLAETVRRDLEDHRAVVQAVEERATKDAKFVRRVLYTAGGMVMSAIVGAVVLIYQAGAKSEAGKAEVRESRQQVLYQIEKLESALTEMRGQVKLLLETQIRGRP